MSRGGTAVQPTRLPRSPTRSTPVPGHMKRAAGNRARNEPIRSAANDLKVCSGGHRRTSCTLIVPPPPNAIVSASRLNAAEMTPGAGCLPRESRSGIRQKRTYSSSATVASRFPSSAHDMPWMRPLCAGIDFNARLESKSQSFRRPSRSPETSSLPLEPKSTQTTSDLCPLRVKRSLPVAASQTLIEQSSLAVAKSVPSGEKSTQFTSWVCPLQTQIWRPDARLQMRAV